ncbi:ribose-phosphate pyrophosphokinase 1 [Pyrenophora tritici-repentis]|uniref:Ribose-phosphate pyrophosphokinase 1 n=1 Tax=Pyrenophora tritici-repentis TaxID=45151 RepID=A0A2W1DDC5_9PLEO|nr:ribose-phosphate pyrophosphokinase 1 protein [Pyrenophora tritici-repentis]KAF7569857.1 ribose-phosphate pyrophosphokinase 1 [Pyrenophora tritici-repentis]KAI0574694.1 ribose-phosphate pyrophosphokinase 1 protein [Pyrenophora tritici-repentis]KAI0579454.1 ribose-phosphate pyrophosphokinase 1 protein [Pyrenophora tritici-repentis]KAI0608189.1 ribose-phosphate pyrophosphokinase 1 protein [Pyrenophora tritici-repentis]
MRGAIVFGGSSHPKLVEGMCDRLGMKPGSATLGKFKNGETSVTIHTSIRNKDVFIVQSGSEKINDSVMELLIMISACKGGSAKSVTAVMPYFPYSRQSKKKQHRGAITARMVANLLHIAGVSHVMTIDLHASQMQGFFKCPVDNLVAEPLLARWIRVNVPNWREAVVVSKNPGGTKRVTSLADALKLSFGIVTTDRRRAGTAVHWNESAMFEQLRLDGAYDKQDIVESALDADADTTPISKMTIDPKAEPGKSNLKRLPSNPLQRRANGWSEPTGSHPLSKSMRAGSIIEPEVPLEPIRTDADKHEEEQAEQSADESAEEYTDERARNVIHGRLVQGHIVDDTHPSPAMSATSHSTWRNRAPSDGENDDIPPQMMSSFMSNASSSRNRETEHSHALGGTYDAAASSEDEEEDLKNPELETMVTLVGNVKDRPVFIVDDMMDKSASWIAAAETVAKRGGATKVYCFATHGIFGGDCLEEMSNCDVIDKIVITNAFPIPEHKLAQATGDKLVIINVDNLLAEAVRRNHHGESMSQLFLHYD